ncbi:MAG TPA: VOC family protein [Vicinamibacterales bacterium]|nr:VOC family protein [Vicinamibacterales bacterium]
MTADLDSPAPPPELTGLLETSLYVEDLERARRFYEELLGFRTVASGDRLIAMAVRPGQVLLLCRRGASTDLPHTGHDGAGRLHLAFAVPADALAAWEVRLSERGVGIVERRSWSAGGRSLYFRDPDGHLLELATPGVWANY